MWFGVLPIAHVVKVLCELSQVRTLLLILLLGPKQYLRNLKGKQEEEIIGLELSVQTQLMSVNTGED